VLYNYIHLLYLLVGGRIICLRVLLYESRPTQRQLYGRIWKIPKYWSKKCCFCRFVVLFNGIIELPYVAWCLDITFSGSRVWTQRKLSLGTMLLIYKTCILPIALYWSETWTLLSTDTIRLQAFHMWCQRQILGIRWQDMVRNTTVTEETDLSAVSDIINTRRSALFGHMVRLWKRTPALRALKLAVDTRCGCRQSLSCRWPRGRARDTWLRPLMRSHTSIQLQWDSAVMCGVVMVMRRNVSCQTRDHDDDHWAKYNLINFSFDQKYFCTKINFIPC